MVLAELKQKERARIIDFSDVNELVQRRLIQLGMKEDDEICVKRKLPFGGPFHVRVRRAVSRHTAWRSKKDQD
ncbi:transcriptional repressor [Bacillus licheniformis]|uniref:FeoA family protein n=1 Tax=Bacillus licheniformis TaxID=1402 RepID=UPI000D8CEB40|nr:transcriptional repressor [Bacillus licheniformis]